MSVRSATVIDNLFFICSFWNEREASGSQILRTGCWSINLAMRVISLGSIRPRMNFG